MSVLYHKKGRIAYITLNRPEVLNAIDPETLEQLSAIWSDFRDDPNLWVAILTGAGDKAFSSGVDLVKLSQLQAEGRLENFESTSAIEAPLMIWKPVIAAVSGYAIGMGCTLALACDIRIAADTASFAYTEVVYGVPVSIGTLWLPRRVPFGLAMEMLLTGDRINAEEAYHIGLVNKVVPLAELMPTAERVANRICENAPLAVWATKEHAIRGMGMPLEQGRRLGRLLLDSVLSSEDAKEGPRAFAEKRKPIYKGR
jgi:E-phenylitaconyl-CoA hydratase